MPAWVRGLIRFLLAIWFRSVEEVGVANCPEGVPLIVVANHENGLIDPMLIAAKLPVRPRFVAKSTLWKNPLLRLFFWLGRIIPVQRRQDLEAGADAAAEMAKNREMFAVAAEVLAQGGSIALFPEGQSHTEPHLQPLKTGAARMAVSGPATLRILPVGIGFDRRDRFRSRALVVVGEPLDPSPERAAAAKDERDAVHALTDRIAEAIRTVTINLPSWEGRRLLERAVEIAEPDDETLEGRHRRMRRFWEAYQTLAREKPAEVEALRREVARYDRALSLLGLTDEEVAARYGPGSVVRWLMRFVHRVILRAPTGLVGAVLHAIPYRLPRLVARRHAHELDQPASWKLMASIVIYPVWWLFLGFLGYLAGGWVAAVGVVFLAPITGWVALRWLESGQALGEQARAFLLLPFRRRLRAELGQKRAEIASGIARLLS